jgi:hypothetical protein
MNYRRKERERECRKREKESKKIMAKQIRNLKETVMQRKNEAKLQERNKQINNQRDAEAFCQYHTISVP